MGSNGLFERVLVRPSTADLFLGSYPRVPAPEGFPGAVFVQDTAIVAAFGPNTFRSRPAFHLVSLCKGSGI